MSHGNVQPCTTLSAQSTAPSLPFASACWASDAEKILGHIPERPWCHGASRPTTLRWACISRRLVLIFSRVERAFFKDRSGASNHLEPISTLPKGAEKKNYHIEASHLVPNSWEPASVWSAHPFHIQLQASQTQYGPSSSCRSGQTRWRLLSSIILGSGGWAKLWYLLDLLWQFPSWNSWRFISKSNSVSCGNLGDLWADLWVCAEECWQLNKAHQFVAANKGLRTMTTKLLEIAS